MFALAGRYSPLFPSHFEVVRQMNCSYSVDDFPWTVIEQPGEKFHQQSMAAVGRIDFLFLLELFVIAW